MAEAVRLKLLIFCWIILGLLLPKSKNNERPGDIMEYVQLLLELFIYAIVLATVVFALIGIQKVYSGYKESKWEKKYGTKLKEDAKRNKWESMERLRDKVFMLEQAIKETDAGINIERIDMIMADVDYDTRYNDYRKNEAKWETYSLSSMVGGFGTSSKAQADLDKDFEKYEIQRKQELREKLKKVIEKDR